VQEEPRKPVYEEPMRPVQEEPRKPVFEEPVKHTYEAPVVTGYPKYAPYKEPEEPEEPEKPKRHRPQRTISGAGTAGGPMEAIMAILSFFTIIPINVDDREIQAMNRNFYLVPIAGLLIGIIAAGIGIVFSELRAWAMIPIAVLATVYILSKFLHFDGLTDFGDGMVSSGDREGSIKALKDTRIGAGGLGIALVVVLATYAGLGGGWIPFTLAAVIVITEVFAKNAMVAAAAFGEPGTGLASEQVGNTNITTMLLSTGISAGLAFAGYLLMGALTSLFVRNGMLDSAIIISAVLLIAGAAASSILIGWLIANLSNKKFGFVNGDVLGAANEISRVLILFVGLIIFGFYTASQLGMDWSILFI
jgi:adenosylcobinamide-GDP ribazoletransferase